MISENQFQKKVLKAFSKRGAIVLNVHGHAMQAPGWPDLFVTMHRWTGWLELKRMTGKVSSLQAIRLRELSARGNNAFVLRAIEDNCYCLEHYDGEFVMKGVTENLPQDLMDFERNQENAPN